jgi:hypothetical protein
MTTGVTNALEVLVGDGKKFASVEDLAKGKLEADTYVKVLELQIADLKTATDGLQKKADRTEALENLMTETTKTNNEGQPNLQAVNDKDKVTTPTVLTQDDIVKLIEARDVAKAQAHNLNIAMDELKKVYGEKTMEVLTTKAASLGLTVEQVQALGRTSSQAMLNLVGATKQPSTQSAATSGSRNAEALNPSNIGGEVHNKAYYETLKKEMGILKFVNDRSVQAQLHRDMSRLGDEWDT